MLVTHSFAHLSHAHQSLGNQAMQLYLPHDRQPLRLGVLCMLCAAPSIYHGNARHQVNREAVAGGQRPEGAHPPHLPVSHRGPCSHCGAEQAYHPALEYCFKFLLLITTLNRLIVLLLVL
eukprot:scaffold54225_cov17-Tisochrysis_lutea.AAC.1